MRPKLYKILDRALEEGAYAGYQRAHKHDDSPGVDHIVHCILQAQVDAITEVIVFDDYLTP